MKLLGRAEREESEPELVALAYAQLYDRRAGAIEVEIREDKQGVGLCPTEPFDGRSVGQDVVLLGKILFCRVVGQS
jgi:hypothetical protein